MKWISLYFVCVRVFTVPHIVVFPFFLVSTSSASLYRFFTALLSIACTQSYANLFSALSDSFPIQIITCVRNIDSCFFHSLFSCFPFFTLSLSNMYDYILWYMFCERVFCMRPCIESDKPKYELVEAESIERERWENSRFFCHTTNTQHTHLFVVSSTLWHTAYTDAIRESLNCYGKCMKIKHFT